MSPIILVVVVIILIAVLPRWKYSSTWGYKPSGIIAIILIALLLLFLFRVKEVGIKDTQSKTKIEMKKNKY